MKLLSVRFGVILIGFIVFGYMKVCGGDWKVYAELKDDVGVFYYASDSITHPSKNIVKVVTKTVFSKNAVAKRVKVFGKKFENLSHTEFLREVDCEKKEDRVMQLTSYTKDGKVLSFGDYKEAKWGTITPNSISGALFEAMCK